jgi:3-oxoacyl-[acyl-carrier protein] reductase
VDTITRVLALELGGRKVRVNTVAPGSVDTDGTGAFGLIGSDLEKTTGGEHPLGQLVRPDDVARVVIFLASDESSWLTGA